MKLVEVQVGSQMWGLQRPDSDIDTREVVAWSFVDLISPWGAKPVVADIKAGEDRTLYEVARFCKLAASGNPTMMEVLFAGDDNILYAAPQWRDLDRHWFIDDDRIAKAHLGFAQSQRDQIAKLWARRTQNSKRIGKALSSGILTIRAGRDLLRHRAIDWSLNDEERQFHTDVRIGHRLIEASEELDRSSKALEEDFMLLPDNGPTIDRRAITTWLADLYAGVAYLEVGLPTAFYERRER